MSLLKAYGTYLLGIAVIVMAACIWGQYSRIQSLNSALELSNGIIRQLQQSQELSEAASQKYQERKEALANEHARQQKIINDALDSNKDWAGEFLPASVLRLLGAETTDTGSVPATDGAAQ